MSPNYSPEPADARQFTAQYDAFYSRFSPVYDRLVKSCPLWRKWLDNALPCLQGPKVLEVSFGTGYLLTRYAGQYESYAVDLNFELARIARSNMVFLYRAGSVLFAVGFTAVGILALNMV